MLMSCGVYLAASAATERVPAAVNFLALVQVETMRIVNA